MIGPAIGVALKLTPRRVDVDPLTGEAAPDKAPARASPAGLAALEIALRLRHRWHSRVTVVTVGPAAADAMLRDALALGAGNAVRIEPPRGHRAAVPGLPAPLAAVAAALAGALAGCPVIVCGDGGHDGGTGAVPGLLAARTGHAQALGLTSVEPADDAAAVRAERRLDRGWKERLVVRAPMVLSVESAIAVPRRASVTAILAARDTPIPVIPCASAGRAGGGGGGGDDGRALKVLPYRPRAQALRAPDGAAPLARVLALLGSGSNREPPERVQAEPAVAARRIAGKLRGWGYL